MIDSTKITAWFVAHAPALVLYARQWLDLGAAEDVVQDAFARLMLLDPEPRDERAWLFRAVRNAAIGRTRSIFRRFRRERAVAHHDLFDGRIDDLIDARVAEESLKLLPQRQREVVVLRIWAEMGFEEIAELLGVSTTTAFIEHREALGVLRAKLEQSCRKKTS